MIIVGECPICHSKDNAGFLFAKDFPYFTAPVAKPDKAKILKKYGPKELGGELCPVVCKECRHIYLNKSAPEDVLEDLYGSYYSYPSALEGSFFPERDEAFIQIFKNRIKGILSRKQDRVLEIGCYDGYVLYYLKKIGFSVTGCDPSHGADIGQRFGLDIKKRFFSTDEFQKENLDYDCIIFRHFLEHIPRPVDFLKTLPKVLTPEGLIVFEVPNVEIFLKSGGTGVFSFQHLQYFSKTSISRLVKEAGLRLINCIETAENLVVVAAQGTSDESITNDNILILCRDFKTNMTKKKDTLWTMLEKFDGQDFILWGAGGYSASIMEMYEVPSNRIKCMVDSDKKKWGMEYLKHDVPIVSPEALKHNDYGCLLICSMYSNEIVDKLKIFDYHKPVISLSPDIKLIKEG